MFFNVKCKRCNSLLETDISPSSWGYRSEVLEKPHTIKCPRCHNVNTYGADEFFVAKQ